MPGYEIKMSSWQGERHWLSGQQKGPSEGSGRRCRQTCSDIHLQRASAVLGTAALQMKRSSFRVSTHLESGGFLGGSQKAPGSVPQGWVSGPTSLTLTWGLPFRPAGTGLPASASRRNMGWRSPLQQGALLLLMPSGVQATCSPSYRGGSWAAAAGNRKQCCEQLFLLQVCAGVWASLAEQLTWRKRGLPSVLQGLSPSYSLVIRDTSVPTARRLRTLGYTTGPSGLPAWQGGCLARPLSAQLGRREAGWVRGGEHPAPPLAWEPCA